MRYDVIVSIGPRRTATEIEFPMPHFEVSPAKPHELLPACRLLFGAPGADDSRERLLSLEAESGLFVARRAGRVCAAALAQSLPGALGVLCPPRGDSLEAEDAVALAACEWLQARAKVCQAFAEADEVGRMGALERAGFRYTTQLVFMRGAARPGRLNIGEVEQRLRIKLALTLPFADAHAELLLATHAGSLDCPELNAARTPAELVAGFQGANDSEWYTATVDGARIGLALIEPGDEPTLAYLGVVPEARNRGWGAELLGAILSRVAGSRSVTLSVDVRNTPAVRLYTKSGFSEYERRGVWLATWPA